MSDIQPVIINDNKKTVSFWPFVIVAWLIAVVVLIVTGHNTWALWLFFMPAILIGGFFLVIFIVAILSR
jgi:hypothetical protein